MNACHLDKYFRAPGSTGKELLMRRTIAFAVNWFFFFFGRIMCCEQKSRVFTKWLFYFQTDAMMSCPLPIVPVIQPLPALNTQPDFPIHIGIKVSLNKYILFITTIWHPVFVCWKLPTLNFVFWSFPSNK